MGLFAKLAGSTELVAGMAERVGVDLAAPVARDPEIEGARYRSLVLRCSTCLDQAACAALQKSCDHLDAAPHYCVNKDFLEASRDS